MQLIVIIWLYCFDVTALFTRVPLHKFFFVISKSISVLIDAIKHAALSCYYRHIDFFFTFTENTENTINK